ncbi:MAG: helix-turn-helix domain-containing protein [Clostridia bacterium]|nr:helix-turn-helix domain-containing protein [Clostridia bacterium]
MNDIEKLAVLAESADELLALHKRVQELEKHVSTSQAQMTVLNTRQVAEIFGVCPKTICKWVSEGRIPAVRSRGSYRYPAAKLFDYIGERIPDRAQESKRRMLAVAAGKQ